jgi:hypothetical protein
MPRIVLRPCVPTCRTKAALKGNRAVEVPRTSSEERGWVGEGCVDGIADGPDRNGFRKGRSTPFVRSGAEESGSCRHMPKVPSRRCWRERKDLRRFPGRRYVFDPTVCIEALNRSGFMASGHSSAYCLRTCCLKFPEDFLRPRGEGILPRGTPFLAWISHLALPIEAL